MPDRVRSILKIRDKLLVHPPDDGKSIQEYVLRVDGLVRRVLNLTLGDMKKLPQQDLMHDFTCLEGWTVPDVSWSGVKLETVLSLAEPSPEARCPGKRWGISISLQRDAAAHVLLAIYLDSTPVPPEYGGPVRLIVPGGNCFMNIKWLDHLELRIDSGAEHRQDNCFGPLGFCRRGRVLKENRLDDFGQ